MSLEDFHLIDNKTIDNSVIKRFFENLLSTSSKYK